MRKLLAVALLFVACTAFADSRASIHTMLDDWHDAPADADEARYFAAMAPEFVFLGTGEDGGGDDSGEEVTIVTTAP